MIPTALALLLALPALGQGLTKQDDKASASAVPHGLEEGSTKKQYVVNYGDTLESIAADMGVMPADLRQWNDMSGTAVVSPGDKLAIWVAPVAPTPAPAAAPEPEKEEPAPKDDGERSGVAMFVGVQVGPAIAFSSLGVAAMPRLELGVELPVWDRRIRIFAAGSWARPVATGEGKDDRLPDPGRWSYQLKQQEWTVALGPTLRLPNIADPIIPEFSIGPQVYFLDGKVNGWTGDVDSNNAFGESREQYTRVGIYGSAGAAMELGPGELNLNLAFSSTGLNGTITGDKTNTAALNILLGYRFVF